MNKPKMKKALPYLYDGPSPSKEDKVGGTEDIYDTEEREEMLEDDEITVAEAGFMEGREQAPSKKATRKNAVSHYDSIADELAKEDAEDG